MRPRGYAGNAGFYIIVAEVIPTMTSLIVASFLTNALYAVLFSSSLQFIGLGNPGHGELGHDAVLGAEQRGAADRPADVGARPRRPPSPPLGAAFALLNYAFDEIGNPALRPVRRSKRGRRA